MTITDIEEAIGNDRPLDGSRFMIVETASVKTILK